MAINFPTNPQPGDQHSTDKKTWQWSGSAWDTLEFVSDYTDNDVGVYLGDLNVSLVPDTNASYDLGSLNNKFRSLYLSDSIQADKITTGTNIATGNNASAIGGGGHSATGDNSISLGGINNITLSPRTAVLGGQSSTAGRIDPQDSTRGQSAVTVGGQGLSATDNFSAAVGGLNSLVSGKRACIIGGSNNEASGDDSEVLGGQNGKATATQSTVVGGNALSAISIGSIAAGGDANSANGLYSAIIGGSGSVNDSNYSAIVGATNAVMSPGHNRSVILGGVGLSSFAANTVYVPSLDVNAGFKMPTGASAGYVLTTDANGVGTWVQGGGTVQGVGANTLNIQAKDEGTVAGNARAEKSVDLQTERLLATEVASGNNSVIIGGFHNTASGFNSTVLGGNENRASGSKTIAAGDTAIASHDGSKVFADSTETALSSIAADEFAIQASALRLVDGNEGAGKVLTCDANGSGNWADASVGGVSCASYSIADGSTSALGTLNITEDFDADGIGTVSSGVVTLGAGTYMISHYGEYREEDADNTDYYFVHTRHNGANQTEFQINETDSYPAGTGYNGYYARNATFLITSTSTQTVDIYAVDYHGSPGSATLFYRNVKLSILKLA